MTVLRTFAALAALLTGTSSLAQQATVVAVPPLSTPSDQPTSAGSTAAIAWQASQMIASDLQSASELIPIAPDQKDFYSYPEVTAPTFSKWRGRNAKLLVTGFVQARSDGRVTFGCYIYDVQKGREVDRSGFVAAPDDWRRAAHKCSGLAYKAATGAPGIFDTRIAYVAESGVGDGRVRRVAIMDSDGYNHRFLTKGEAIVLTPRLSPKASRVAYVSFATGTPQVVVLDVASGTRRVLVPGETMSFAPRFSPDGSQIAFSMTFAGNTDIYIADANGGMAKRLTSAPGIDTDPSFSPDGSKIVFESDRSGSQQLYAMNADGSDERRVSFGTGAHATPDWSPDGSRIAFTWRGGGALRIGVMNADGSDERILTAGSADEGPSWAPSGRDIVFQHSQGTRRSIYRVSIAGGEPQQIATPQDASDPDWSGPMD